MSEPPVTASWEFDQDRFIPVAKTTDSKSTPKTKTSSSSLLGLAIMAIAAIASGMALIHYGNLVMDNWNIQRETSAQTELARLRSCINN